MKISTFVSAFLCVSALIPSSQADDNWPRFRGPNAGVSDGKSLPATWDTKTNVAWAIDVPGRGWSSPVVWGDKIFLTTVEREGKYEDAKKGLYFGGERAKAPEMVHHWKTICIDANTGKTLWDREAAAGKPSTGVHIKNSFASETPVTDGKYVYSYFGNKGVYCYDLDGKHIWSKEFEAVPTKFSWGTAASPVLYKDRLFIINDNEKESYLLCLNAETGKPILAGGPRGEKATGPRRSFGKTTNGRN